MAVRKSPKRPRSDRGNGPGGSLGNIPLGMSARLAIAIVHDSSQRIVSHMTLFLTWTVDSLLIYRLGVAILLERG